MSIPKIPKIPMPGHFIGQMPNGQMQVAMNPQAFEDLIKGKGIRMIHSRPLPCPNIKDIHAGDHSPACDMCHNGTLYYGEKEFIGAFFSNSNDRQFQIQGQWDYENVTICIPITYEDGTDMDVQLYDQISVKTVTPVRYYQRVEHSQSGIDRLQFPAVKVDQLMDATGKQYYAGIDFEIEEGNIKWTTQNRPGYDLSIERGVIYSVNYYCEPIFTIISLPHQFRTTQTIGADGKPYATRFPQLASCRKDFVPYHSSDKIGPADTPEPRSGQLL
jgi:hypothetical protein